MTSMYVQSHLVLFILLSSSMSSKATILEDACKNVAAMYKVFIIRYDDCIKVFQADKGSATADKLGLAIIAVNTSIVAAQNIGERIVTLQASEKENHIQQLLHYCAEEYAQAVLHLGYAMNYTVSSVLKKGHDKRSLWRLAQTDLYMVRDVGLNCEDRFGEQNRTSLLSAENSEYTKKAYIANGMNPLEWN